MKNWNVKLNIIDNISQIVVITKISTTRQIRKYPDKFRLHDVFNNQTLLQ
jgi:hypothetical protein